MPAIAESLAEAARWLRGSDRYRSPFDSACRPVSMAVLAASDISGDAQALVAELGTTDLRDDLPGAQSAPVSWIAPGPRAFAVRSAHRAEPRGGAHSSMTRPSLRVRNCLQRVSCRRTPHRAAPA